MELTGLDRTLIPVRFSLTDTGCGIADADSGQIFEEVSQIGKTGFGGGEGSGLERAISRRLAERGGGEIGYQSALNRGSAFWLDLTLCVPPQPCVSETCGMKRIETILRPLPAPPPEASGLRILLAEDTVTNQIVVEQTLSRLGHTADCVDNGRDALQALQSRPYALVLMDIAMPIMDGVETTRHIRAIEGPEGRVPIVALTAFAMEEDRQRFLAAGMNEVLTKPLSPDRLAEAIAVQHGRNACHAPANHSDPMRDERGRPQVAIDPTVLFDAEPLDAVLGSIDEEILPTLFERFRADVTEPIGNAIDGAQQTDVKVVECASHVLKSVSGTVGAVALYEAAVALNDACRSSGGSQDRPALADRLMAAGQRTLMCFQRVIHDRGFGSPS